MHPEIGSYWKQVVDSSTDAYQRYLRDVSYTRVKIAPNEALASNTIERRIEARLLTMLNNVLPSGIVRQCDDRETVTCAFIMYRTLVYAGPASKDDCAQMMDILTKPRVYELSKLQEAMIHFRYARLRLQKYGHQQPDAGRMFETLKVAAQNLMEKDESFSFMFRHYMMKHSSVNGLMELSTVQEVYDMIVEYARGFIDASSSAEAKTLQQRTKDRKRFPDQSGIRNPGEMECFGCGSKDHVLKACPKKQTTSQQRDKREYTLSEEDYHRTVPI